MFKPVLARATVLLFIKAHRGEKSRFVVATPVISEMPSNERQSPTGCGDGRAKEFSVGVQMKMCVCAPRGFNFNFHLHLIAHIRCHKALFHCRSSSLDQPKTHGLFEAILIVN